MADFDTLFGALVQQESRGKHRDDQGNLTRSPVGALGITQIMPATGKAPGFGVKPLQNDTEEEYIRFGRDYLGAMLTHFDGDEAKALAAYNGGAGTVQNAVRKYGDDWFNHVPAESQDYVRKITAGAGRPLAAPMPPQAAGAPELEPIAPSVAMPDVPQDFPPDAQALAPTDAVKANPYQMAAARLMVMGQAVSTAEADTRAWQAGVEQDLENEAGFLVATGAALSDPQVMSEIAIYNMVKGGMADEPHDPNWDFRTEYEKAEGALSVEEREFLFENGGGGQGDFDRAMTRIMGDRDLNRTYEKSGALATLAGQIVAGFASPTNYISGAVVGRAAKSVSTAYKLANNPAARAAGFVAENVVGNVATEAMLDAMGERRTASDYMLAAGMGAAFSIPFIPGEVRRAQADHANEVIGEMIEAGKNRIGPDRNREADRDIKELTKINQEQGNRLGKIMPDDVEAHIRELAGEKAPESTPPVAPTAPKAETLDFPVLGGGTDVRTKVEDFVNNLDLDDPEGGVKLREFLQGPDRDNYLNDPDSKPAIIKKIRQLEENFAFTKSNERAGELHGLATSYNWDARKRNEILNSPTTQGVYSAREVIEAVINRTFSMVNRVSAMGERTAPGDLIATAKWLKANEKHLGEWLDKTPLSIENKPPGGQVYPNTGVAQVFSGDYDNVPGSGLPQRLQGESREDFLKRAMNDELLARIALHELMHTRTIHFIKAFQRDPSLVPLEVRRSLEAMDAIRLRMDAHLQKTDPVRVRRELAPGGNRTGAHYASMDLHELYSQLTASYGTETRAVLAAMPPSPGFAGRLSSALEEMWLQIRKMIGLPNGAPRGTALGEALFHLERTVLFDQKIVDPRGIGLYEPWPARRLDASGQAYLARTDSFGKEVKAEGTEAAGAQPVNPATALQAQKRFADSLYQSARQWVAQNPIDLTRANTLVSKFGALVADGITMAKSKNPLLQQMAGLVAEVSTGAAGRRSTVAIRATYLEEQLVGLGMRRYDSAYEQWKRARNVNRAAGWWNDATAGDLRQQFDREVYGEIINRRNDAYVGRTSQATTDVNVLEAANALEEGFKRGLDAQKQGATIGSTALPEDSRGYIPQALDGRILHSDPTAIPHLIEALANQWQHNLGWEPAFAKQFAEFYLERARTRALGNRNVDLSGASVDGTQLIRETLEEMVGGANTPGSRDFATEALLALNRTAGASQTKSRLDIDLLQTLPNGRRIMDYYTVNPSLLYRKYMHRVAGEVALTEFGVPGARGARYMRESMVLHRDPAEMATEEELAAYDRVIGQILGRPVPGEVVSQAATNMRLFASMARLGGAGITQFQEVWNAMHHIGLRSSLAALGQLPKMIGEVGRLKKGQKVGGVLGDLATLGGDVGMRDYYLVAPLDAPDQRSLTHGDDVGIVGRLLRAGSHIQQRMSFMQGIHAAQHRAMAEQILLKAAKMLKDPDFLAGRMPDSAVVRSMRDMGFSDGLMTRLSATVDRWATFDAQGNLTKLDVTMMPDRADAEEFMQAIHRGTRQIIQGTYPGETGAWAHNDWLKLLLQFRTFSVVSADKQFARTRMNHGMAQAAGFMLGSMATAIPLHLARVQLAALGREDREDYVERQTNWQALMQASMNYTALSGLGGDAVELAMVGYSGWSGQEIESVKGRGQSLTGQIPAVGVIEQGFRVASGKGNVHDALNLLPGSRLPFMIPLMNMTRDSE